MMPPNEINLYRSLPPDILSNLPNNVIDVILMCLPCKDAVRTSVLSTKWRYHWCRLTKLKLNESHWKSEKDLLYPTVKFMKIAYQIMTLHEGPITKFTLKIPDLETCPKIDNFICFLSRNGLQDLSLRFPAERWPSEPSEHVPEEIPSSLFTCSQLRHLNLYDCSIRHPSASTGLDSLISLKLCRVKISSELLEGLISHCPLLEQLVLDMLKSSDVIEVNALKLKSFDFTGIVSSICLKDVPLLSRLSLTSSGDYTEARNSDIAKFFKSCYALEHELVKLDHDLQFDVGAPSFAMDLCHAKRLYLDSIVLTKSYSLSFALCLIRSFPYLEYLEIKVSEAGYPDIECLLLQLRSGVTFNHLGELVYRITSGTVMQLTKLLLAKSPVLARMRLYPDLSRDKAQFDTRLEILDEVSEFWHASPQAVVDVVTSPNLRMFRISRN